MQIFSVVQINVLSAPFVLHSNEVILFNMCG